MSGVTLIIGLGNIGEKYARTRHNAGFDVVDILCQRHGLKLNKRRCHALLCEERLFGKRIVLAQPQTYMNDSGIAFVELMNYYKPEPENCVVVYDDVDLALGRLRIRGAGSAGTHNGMRSILYHHQSENFPRIRVGIGKPPPRWDMKDWVTGHYSPLERQPAFDGLCRAADAVELLLKEGVEAAMRTFNAAPAQESPSPPSTE